MKGIFATCRHKLGVGGGRVKKGLFALIGGLFIGAVLSFIFLTVQDQASSSTMDVYYFQIGVYQTKDNATKMQLKLNSNGIHAYVYEKDGMNYVICAVSTDLEELKTYESLLGQRNISYVRKEKTLINVNSNDDLIECLLEEIT